MTTKEREGQSPEQSKKELSELRSDWVTADIEEGFREIERGGYRTIEIDEQNRTYRTIE